MDALLWSRWKDGNRPVTVTDVDGDADCRIYRVDTPAGPETFASARGLLSYLTGHPGARNWTFDRYFGLGLWAKPSTRDVPMMDVLELLPPGGIVVDRSSAPVRVTVSPDVTVGTFKDPRETFKPVGETFRAGESFAETLTGPKKFGVDLSKRGHEVRKLLFKGFGSWMFSAGHDPEEVFQEVCKGLLVRNRGRGAFDASRSSFGHYVHNVCRCVLSNWHRRETRRRSHEQTGMKEWRDGSLVGIDAAESSGFETRPPRPDPWGGVALAESDLLAYMHRAGAGRTSDGRLALEVFPLIAQGLSRADIVALVDPRGGKAAVGRAVALVRNFASRWARLDG